MKIISWNINGLNSLMKKDAFDEIFTENPDILYFQEVKIKEIPEVDGYYSYHNPSKKIGSGVAIYTKIKPESINNELQIEKFDEEGRLQRFDFGNFKLYNVYFPSGGRPERLGYKFEFFNKITEEMKKEEKPVILCGDFNRISKEIDAKNVKNIINKSGFLKEEQEWFNDILASGYIDAFRLFHKEGDHFTWWPYSRNAREQNNGYRFDHFLVDERLKNILKDSYILKNQLGSDHAPIVLELD